MSKLDPGLHSTKGVGKTEPDPAGTKELDSCKVNNFDLDFSSSFLSLTVNKWTAQVPAGAGVKDGNKKTDLLYNEYIVYDVAQVHPNLWSAVSKHCAISKCWLIIPGASQVSPTDEVQLQDINTFALSSYRDIMHHFLFLQYLMIM